MAEMNVTAILEKLGGLRTELIELAFTLEGRGRLDAADVAMTTSARVGELCDELAAKRLAARPKSVAVSRGAKAVALRPPQ
jgi:hypothetical protein